MADTVNAAATAPNPAEAPKAESSDRTAEVKPTTSTDAPAGDKADDSAAGDKAAGEVGAQWRVRRAPQRPHRAQRRAQWPRRPRPPWRAAWTWSRSRRLPEQEVRSGARLCMRRANSPNRRNEEFDNLPETDDPVEIRNQVRRGDARCEDPH
jgi:lupus La protein